jgi:hypothetical protein
MPNEKSNGGGPMPEVKPEVLGFLLEDYRLKVEYFSGHLSRIWTRFNFLLTIDSALFALVTTRDHAPATSLLFTILGVALSLFWLVFGWFDIRLSDRYRSDIKHAHCLLVQAHKDPLVIQPYVGATKGPITSLHTAIFLPAGFLGVWLLWLYWRIDTDTSSVLHWCWSV